MIASEVAVVAVINGSFSNSVIMWLQCEGARQLQLSVACTGVKVINSLINEEHEVNSTQPNVTQFNSS